MTIAFLESPRFPDDLSVWAKGGRGFKTTIVTTYGGDEYRNGAWTQRLGRWEIVNAWRVTNPAIALYNGKLLTDFSTCNLGQLGAFRFKDPQDFDDGGAGIFVLLTATTFQMYKRYTKGALTHDGIVQKPVSATVVVTGGVTPVVDYTTGIVTVASGTPTSWTGQYDVPVRFDGDYPDIGLDESTGALLNWQAIKLVQVRNF